MIDERTPRGSAAGDGRGGPEPPLEAGGAARDAALRAAVWDDLVTEYDARFLDAFLRDLDVPLSPAFWASEARWLADEERHHDVFRDAWSRVFDPGGVELARLAERRPDFGPIAHLFTDEFAIACLGAYDELVTIRGYRGNLPLYAKLGDAFSGRVRRVIADEAAHYRRFLDLALAHPREFHRAPRVVARIQAATWTEYAATFVLDHDDPVYDDRIMREAGDVLLRQIERARPRAAGPQASSAASRRETAARKRSLENSVMARR